MIQKPVIQKPDKKSLWYLAVVTVIALLVFAGLWYYISLPPKIEVLLKKPAGRDMKKILESLGTLTPGEEGREVPEEVLESLGGSGKEGREIPEGVLEGLGTPE